VSEKSFAWRQAGLVGPAKTSRRNPADLAGACSGDRSVVSGVGEAYDATSQRCKAEIPVNLLPGCEKTELLKGI
jgi:hypothetical protein